MKKLLLLFICLPSWAGTVDITYTFTDFNLTAQAVKRATQTPIKANADYNGAILSANPVAKVTSGAGSVTFSNTIAGYVYRIQLDTPYGSTVRTCAPPANLTGAINGRDYLGNIGPAGDFYYLYPTGLVNHITSQDGTVTITPGSGIGSVDLSVNVNPGTNGGLPLRAGTNTTVTSSGGTNIVSGQTDTNVVGILAKSAIVQDAGVVNITDSPYNADATGVADSTAGIQAAIDYAGPNGKKVYAPLGNYKLSAPLNLTTNYPVITGAGSASGFYAPASKTVFQWTSTSNGIQWIGSANTPNLYRPHISGIALIGPTNGSTGAGIWLGQNYRGDYGSVQGGQIDDITVSGFANGVELHDTVSVAFNNPHLLYNTNIDLALRRADSTVVRNAWLGSDLPGVQSTAIVATGNRGGNSIDSGGGLGVVFIDGEIGNCYQMFYGDFCNVVFIGGNRESVYTTNGICQFTNQCKYSEFGVNWQSLTNYNYPIWRVFNNPGGQYNSGIQIFNPSRPYPMGYPMVSVEGVGPVSMPKLMNLDYFGNADVGMQYKATIGGAVSQVFIGGSSVPDKNEVGWWTAWQNFTNGLSANGFTNNWGGGYYGLIPAGAATNAAGSSVAYASDVNTATNQLKLDLTWLFQWGSSALTNLANGIGSALWNVHGSWNNLTNIPTQVMQLSTNYVANTVTNSRGQSVALLVPGIYAGSNMTGTTNADGTVTLTSSGGGGSAYYGPTFTNLIFWDTASGVYFTNADGSYMLWHDGSLTMVGGTGLSTVTNMDVYSNLMSWSLTITNAQTNLNATAQRLAYFDSTKALTNFPSPPSDGWMLTSTSNIPVWTQNGGSLSNLNAANLSGGPIPIGVESGTVQLLRTNFGGTLSNLNAGALTGGVWRIDVPGFALGPADSGSMTYLTNGLGTTTYSIQGSGPSNTMWQASTTATNNIFIRVPLPFNYDGGPVNVEMWFTGGTNFSTKTTNVVSFAGSTFGSALGTAKTVTNQVPTTTGYWRTNAAVTALTLGGTPVPGATAIIQGAVWGGSPQFSISNNLFVTHAAVWGTSTNASLAGITMP